MLMQQTLAMLEQTPQPVLEPPWLYSVALNLPLGPGRDCEQDGSSALLNDLLLELGEMTDQGCYAHAVWLQNGHKVRCKRLAVPGPVVGAAPVDAAAGFDSSSSK